MSNVKYLMLLSIMGCVQSYEGEDMQTPVFELPAQECVGVMDLGGISVPLVSHPNFGYCTFACDAFDLVSCNEDFMFMLETTCQSMGGECTAFENNLYCVQQR